MQKSLTGKRSVPFLLAPYSIFFLMFIAILLAQLPIPSKKSLQ